MRTFLSHKVLFLAFVILSCSVAVVWHKELTPHATAQISCTSPATLSLENTWPQGARVNVNIDPAYTSAQRSAIAAAFANWNAASSVNCSGVVFNTPTYNSTPIAGPGVTNTLTYKFQVYKQNPPPDPLPEAAPLAQSTMGGNWPDGPI